MGCSSPISLPSGRLGLLLGALLLLGCGQEANLRVIPASPPDQLVLYSIDGTKFPEQVPATAEKFHEFEVLGKLEIADPNDRDALMKAVADGMSRGARQDDMVPECFWPRHALRATWGGRVTDYVICFQCELLNIHRGGSMTSARTGDQHQDLFNRRLRQAGIPIAP